jgi:hypothetical protein
VTFRWCCVRVKASEIAFVGFDHLPVAREQFTPTSVLGLSPNTYNYAERLGFCRKSGFLKEKRRTSFPVRFRLSFWMCQFTEAFFFADNHQGFKLPQFSLADAQQVLPLAKVGLEADALGDLKRRDDAPLDLIPTRLAQRTGERRLKERGTWQVP